MVTLRLLYVQRLVHGVDYQQGTIRHNVFSDTDVWRHVFGVSVSVAPRYSRSIKGPDDPQTRARGLSMMCRVLPLLLSGVCIASLASAQESQRQAPSQAEVAVTTAAYQ